MTDRAGRHARSFLVTGAAGFIGSALCQRLVSAGHRVTGYDDLSRGRREYLSEGVGFVEGDIRDRTRFRELLSAMNPDCVIHLAAMHFIPDCIARPRETFDVNVTGTRCVLESCRERPVGSVIFASSAAVYAPTDLPCVEDASPLRPAEVYGESKLAAEQLAAAFYEETGVPVSILRLFNAVGRNETNPHVVPHIFESLRVSNTVALGNVEPRRDYIDTRDLAEAILVVSESSPGFRVLNVGTGVAHSVSDIVESLRRILGRPIIVEHELSRMRATERMLLVADLEKTRLVTGWSPRLSLEETLQDLVQAYDLQAEPRLAE